MKKTISFFLIAWSLCASSASAEFKGKIKLSDLANLARSYESQLIKVTESYEFGITTVHFPNGDRYSPVTDDSSISPTDWSTNVSAVGVMNALCDFKTISTSDGDKRAGGESISYCVVR